MKRPLTRRGFMNTVAGVALASRLQPDAAAQSASGDRARVIDCHVHCFAGANDPRFPYHPSAPYRPARAVTPEFLISCMDTAGVDRAVIVHPEPYQDDLRYLEHCLDVGNGRLKGVCLLFAHRDDTARRLRDIVQRRPGQIVAVRLHAYAPERLPNWRRPDQLRQLWRTAGELGLAVQLHLEPRYAPRLEPFLREFRSVTTIVDHLGRPFQGTPQEHGVILKWSRFSKVIAKISVVPDQNQYPHRDIRPVIRQLTDAFGPERLIWGEGLDPESTGASYRKERESVAGLFSHLAQADRDAIFGETARRWLQIS